MNTNSNQNCQMTSQQFVALDISDNKSGAKSMHDCRKDSKLKQKVIAEVRGIRVLLCTL